VGPRQAKTVKDWRDRLDPPLALTFWPKRREGAGADCGGTQSIRFMTGSGRRDLRGQFSIPVYTRMGSRAPTWWSCQLIGVPRSGSGLHPFLYARASQCWARILTRIGRAYIGGSGRMRLAAVGCRACLRTNPIGVCFSRAAIDSGSVFLTVYHVMLKLGMHPYAGLRLLCWMWGDGPDVGAQGRVPSWIPLGLGALFS